MKTALIGYTGFVGSNIASQVTFDDYYNSKNIEDIRGKNYDLIVSAGTKAEVWKANQDPKSDWLGIKTLLDNLQEVTVNHFILISSVLVYPNPNNVDEDTQININELTMPYGKNRYKMEKFILKHFLKTTIIRAPQLFGDGLKKNFVYDLIHNNALDFTHKDSLLQWYNLKNIWNNIQVAVENEIPVLNLAVEPITAQELAKYTIDMNFNTVTEKPPLVFNFQTKYGGLFKSQDQYIYHKKEILEELRIFILDEKKKNK